MTALILVALLAQETQPAAWSSHQKLADGLSTALVGVNMGAEVIHAWRSEDRKHALGCFALENGLTIGATETVKFFVHRTRPDGSDRKSFYSEHTALAVVNTGWRFQVSIPIAIGAGYGRAAAGKHYFSDVATGAVVGLLAGKVCR